MIDGSPRVALEFDPPFDQYVFIEVDERRLADLRELELEYKGRREIAVRVGDCNEYSLRECSTFASDRLWRGVLFLDPFGVHVPWSTIEQLADTEHIEVFVNFPVGMAIQRLLPRSGHFSEKQRAKLDEYFGDPAWFDQVYVAERALFGEQLRKYDDAAQRLVTWFRDRRKSAFGFVSMARLIRNSKGGHLYYLVFAGPNETGARIANHVLGPVRPK